MWKIIIKIDNKNPFSSCSVLYYVVAAVVPTYVRNEKKKKETRIKCNIKIPFRYYKRKWFCQCKSNNRQ